MCGMLADGHRGMSRGRELERDREGQERENIQFSDFSVGGNVISFVQFR